MTYKINIKISDIKGIKALSGLDLSSKYRLYLSSVSALNEEREDEKEGALALVLLLEGQLWGEISGAIDRALPVKTVSDFVERMRLYDADRPRKRDLNKSLFLAIVIENMLKILSELEQTQRLTEEPAPSRLNRQ